MAKKTNAIETLIAEKQKNYEKGYGYNFHSMYEFEGITKALLAAAKKNVKMINKMQNLLAYYTSSQIPDDQIKIEATRCELRDNCIWGTENLVALAGALDNFNFSKLLQDSENEE
ncbi:MAG: hypothetical protein IJ593_01080 [Lachnospiraceae bacterium]|nr:hypothetical protein [Lachnospiraceae bacterium]